MKSSRMASIQERIKLKRGQVDTWSTREKLCLAACVARSGNQNWMTVSRNLKAFAGEPGRPADWFSQKSCAAQYDNLLTQIETPKRKKRGVDGNKNDGSDLSPAEVILRQLTYERLEELRKLMQETRSIYLKEKEELYLVESGQADDRLIEMLAQIQEEKKQKEKEKEEHELWLRQREERKFEMELAWRPHAAQQQYRSPASQTASTSQSPNLPRRPSNQSEVSSEADSNLDSPLSTEQPQQQQTQTTVEDNSESKLTPSTPTSSTPVPTTVNTTTAPTPTSPLLTSLLKSPSPVAAGQTSILHSAITSQRGTSPTITSLLNSSPSIPNSGTPSSSSNLKSIVSTAMSETSPKLQSHTSSGAPTLSMLLELPTSAPGQPLPELSSTPTSTTISVEPQLNNTTPLVTTTVSDTGPVKADQLPVISNMDLVLPDDAEEKIAEAETKLNLDTADLQHLSNADLELVMDPMDVVLEELVPSLVLPEEVAVLIEEQVELNQSASDQALKEDPVSTKLENAPEQIQRDSADTESKIQSKLASPEEKLKSPTKPTEETVSLPTTPQAQDSAQQTHTTPDTPSSSLAANKSSPRSASRPSKGNMLGRKINMEDDTIPSAETKATEDTDKSEVDLENASILFVQDNGEVVKLSPDGETNEVVNDIQIIQDSSSNDVVVLPLDNVVKPDVKDVPEIKVEKEDIEETEETDGRRTPRREIRRAESRTPGRTPRKVAHNKKDSPLKDRRPVDEASDSEKERTNKKDLEAIEKESPKKLDPHKKDDVVQKPSPQIDKETASKKEKDEERVTKIVEIVSPREGRKRKSLSLPKREKSPIFSESSNDVLSEEETRKEETSKDKSEIQVVKEKKSDSKIAITVTDDDDSSSTFVKEEKPSRAATPSTEDDSTFDVDQPALPVPKPRRGRAARDSSVYSDSVPNSPASASATPTDDEKEFRAWKKSIMLVYSRIAAHKYASLFLRPITDDMAPGYSQMVYRPLDLIAIKKNIESGVIRTTDEFQRDILHMFNNAIMFNRSGTHVHEMAREMQEEGVSHLKEYVNTQLLVQAVGSEGHISSRRGTRTAERRDQDDGLSGLRRSLTDKSGTPKGATSALLGKRKRSLLSDDKSTPKRRKADE